MRISVNSPSMGRSDNVSTLDYLPYTRVWVDGSEADDYRRNYPKAKIIVCEEGIQGNTSRVRNYILRKEFERGMDAVVMVDDDYNYIGRWSYDEESKFGYNEYRMNADDVMMMIRKYSIVAREFGAKYWGISPMNVDRISIKFSQPFSTKSFVGGPFQCFLKGNRCWFDERMPLKEDYDMTLQQLNLERVVFRANMYHYNCKQSEIKGGCSAYRNMEEERRQMNMLIQKWGSRIVRWDHNSNMDKKKQMDYNPKLSVPISGI